MHSLKLVILSVVSLFMVACGSDYAPPSTSPSPAPPVASTSPAPSLSVSIPAGAATLEDRAYTPDEIDVAAGATVTWTNTDSVAHTSTSNGSGWNSGNIAPGGQFSFAFQTTGTFQYHCAIHPGMVGTVVVR
jgi:plastocyanin